MRKYLASEHTFVVCAYGKSPYLEECVRSLVGQTKKGGVRIATSTPCEYIAQTAKKYGLKVCVNPQKGGIAGDWNFALGCADTALVTLAHQDDVYARNYREKIVEAVNRCRRPIIAFSDYSELRDGRTVENNRLMKIKRLMLSPLRLRPLWNSRFVRRRILSFGNAICCPAVTLVKEALPVPLFKGSMRSNIDWQAWEELSRQRGGFVYVPRRLMAHRIHSDSATSELLSVNGRREEDLQVLTKFWPRPVAGWIEYFYQNGEKSNR